MADAARLVILPPGLSAEAYLVNGGVPAEVPYCRFPAHRPSDWIGENGRMICGVCHPPAGGGS